VAGFLYYGALGAGLAVGYLAKRQMDMMGGGMTGVWFLMMLFGLLAFVGIILLAVWAVTRLSGSERLRAGSTSASAEDPLVILQRRYARGEIGRDDYERIRADLKGSG